MFGTIINWFNIGHNNATRADANLIKREVDNIYNRINDMLYVGKIESVLADPPSDRWFDLTWASGVMKTDLEANNNLTGWPELVPYLRDIKLEVPAHAGDMGLGGSTLISEFLIDYISYSRASSSSQEFFVYLDIVHYNHSLSNAVMALCSTKSVNASKTDKLLIVFDASLNPRWSGKEIPLWAGREYEVTSASLINSDTSRVRIKIRHPNSDAPSNAYISPPVTAISDREYVRGRTNSQSQSIPDTKATMWPYRISGQKQQAIHRTVRGATLAGAYGQSIGYGVVNPDRLKDHSHSIPSVPHSHSGQIRGYIPVVSNQPTTPYSTGSPVDSSGSLLRAGDYNQMRSLGVRFIMYGGKRTGGVILPKPVASTFSVWSGGLQTAPAAFSSLASLTNKQVNIASGSTINITIDPNPDLTDGWTAYIAVPSTVSITRLLNHGFNTTDQWPDIRYTESSVAYNLYYITGLRAATNFSLEVTFD